MVALSDVSSSLSAPGVPIPTTIDALDLGGADAVLQAAVDRLVGDPLFPAPVIEALRAARAEWIAAE
ncbi:MAG: hypothetical protein NTW96_07230 [Planctomycetia bacterium]|nr:hypothetical protein [Planctomycetia bacterium]